MANKKQALLHLFSSIKRGYKKLSKRIQILPRITLTTPNHLQTSVQIDGDSSPFQQVEIRDNLPKENNNF
jgi:diacylglycerol kinase family enzyme